MHPLPSLQYDNSYISRVYVSEPRNQHWYTPRRLFRLHQFYKHSSVCVCVILCSFSCVALCNHYHNHDIILHKGFWRTAKGRGTSHFACSPIPSLSSELCIAGGCHIAFETSNGFWSFFLFPMGSSIQMCVSVTMLWGGKLWSLIFKESELIKYTPKNKNLLLIFILGANSTILAQQRTECFEVLFLPIFRTCEICSINSVSF